MIGIIPSGDPAKLLRIDAGVKVVRGELYPTDRGKHINKGEMIW
jgi:hypothetical protein